MEPTANSPCADQQQNHQLILLHPHPPPRPTRSSGFRRPYTPQRKQIDYSHLIFTKFTKINYHDIFKSLDESESESESTCFSVPAGFFLSSLDEGICSTTTRAEISECNNYFGPIIIIRPDHEKEVRIDIRPPESENAGVTTVDHHHHLMTHKAWTKHINQLKQSKLGISSSTTMGETTTLALCGQALGAVMANVLSTNNNNTNNDNSSSCSWAVCLVEFGVVLGLSFTLAGIGLRGKQRRPFLSLLLTKIGAAAAASATIISLGLQLPPPMAWICSLAAFFIVAVAVVLA